MVSHAEKEGGKVWVQAAKKEGLLWIRVRGNRVGISTEAITHTYAKNVSDCLKASLGLRNVNQRQQHIYGLASCLHIESAPNRGTNVTLCLPFAGDLLN